MIPLNAFLITMTAYLALYQSPVWAFMLPFVMFTVRCRT